MRDRRTSPSAKTQLFASSSVVHSIWRPAQARRYLVSRDLNVTPVRDRCYFQSVYFREPAGFVRTGHRSSRGLAVGEPAQALGEALKLPIWLECYREEIEKALPPVELRHVAKEKQVENPHRNQPVLSRGRPLDSASGAVILLHGRGASAEDILGLVEELQLPELAYFATQAARNTWSRIRFSSLSNATSRR
jgi:hypothetical protein